MCNPFLQSLYIEALYNESKFECTYCLTLYHSRPTRDPFLKRQEEQEDKPFVSDVPAEELLRQNVCKFAGMPYEEQLAAKMSEIEKLMANLRREFMNQVKPCT